MPRDPWGALCAALIVAGAGLISVVSLTEARAALARDRVRAEWAALEARRIADAARRGLEQVVPTEPEPGAPVLRLRIPSIAMDEIVVEGVGARELLASPGHLPGSALPGAVGNAVISAHRDRHFSALDRVRLGDTLFTELGGKERTWRVTRVRVVEAGAPALFSSTQPTLTLTTCWPVRFVGPAPRRLLVSAEPAGG